MKIYHFTLLFILLTISMASICESRIAFTDKRKQDADRYDAAFDRACDAAAAVLRAGGEELSEDMIREAQAKFGNALCTYFGIDVFSQEGRILLQKVPVIAITVPDGIYVGYIADENGTAVRKWTGKILYSQSSPEQIFENYFVKTDLNYNTNGRKLRLALPDEDMGMFARNAQEVGFVAFYKGFSGMGQDGLYTYASSVSRIADHYYINISGSGYASPMYYHTDGCQYKNEECMELNSRKECAEFGAFCCPACRDALF